MRENVALSNYTYYKIGGPARYLAEPESIDDLKKIAAFLKANRVPYFVLGAGSNVLFDDRGFDGLVIYTGKLHRTLCHEQNLLSAGSSISVSHLLRYCSTNGLQGLEFLTGVPGNVGGICYMNAGTKIGDVSTVIESISVFNLSKEIEYIYQKNEIHYTYRTQLFLAPHDVITKATLRIQPSSPAQVQQKIASLLKNRKTSQPIDKPSCGSVFKNPDPEKNVFAWKLVDAAGFRGRTHGGAQVSEMHTNFIINNGGAKFSDVCTLISEIKKEVKNRFGILLEEEVKIIPYNGTCFVS